MAPLLEIEKRKYAAMLSTLHHENDPLSLPLRFLLYASLSGRLRGVRLFASTRRFSNVSGFAYDILACLHSSKEFAMEGSSGSSCSGGYFVVTLHASADFRRASGQEQLTELVDALDGMFQFSSSGFAFQAFLAELQTPIVSVLQNRCPSITRCLQWEPDLFLQYKTPTDCGNFSQKRVLEQMQQRGHRVDELRVEDIAVIMKFWEKADEFPGTHEWLRWLIERGFHTACIRDANGAPVSWCLTYQYGGIGAKFTRETFRNLGYGRFVVRTVLEKWHAEFDAQTFLKDSEATETFELSCWAAVDETNAAEIASDRPLTETICEDRIAWINWFPNKNYPC